MTGATAKAQTGDWQFSITVVEFKNRYYRFILAAPKTNPDIQATGKAIAASFRPMTSGEISSLKPMKLQVVTVRPSDTIAGLSTRMKGVSRQVELFRALNALGKGARLKAGSQVKLVVGG